jgi:hypothetical protein
MSKEWFVSERTKIISKMLDNPNENGIYPTTVCSAELDDLYDIITDRDNKRSAAQILRDDLNDEVICDE